MNQNDLPLEVVLHRIGECPVCHKGQMLQGSAGWTCDYFKNLQDKCTFTIFQSYDGYVLTEDDAVELITAGKTGKRNFHTLDGKPFTAILKLVGNKIKVVGENAILSVRCPKCGGKVKEMQKGYAVKISSRKRMNIVVYGFRKKFAEGKYPYPKRKNASNTGGQKYLTALLPTEKNFHPVWCYRRTVTSPLTGKYASVLNAEVSYMPE